MDYLKRIDKNHGRGDRGINPKNVLNIAGNFKGAVAYPVALHYQDSISDPFIIKVEFPNLAQLNTKDNKYEFYDEGIAFVFNFFEMIQGEINDAVGEKTIDPTFRPFTKELAEKFRALADHLDKVAKYPDDEPEPDHG